MEWSIKSSSKYCFVSGKIFSEGDEVVCFVCIDGNHEFVRFDVLKDFASEFKPIGRIIGQWSKVISCDSSGKLSSEQKTAHQEEFFFSLYLDDESPEKDILKQLFALFLERKRILKTSFSILGEKQKFIHVKTKKEYIVPMKKINPEDLTSLENILEMFI